MLGRTRTQTGKHKHELEEKQIASRWQTQTQAGGHKHDQIGPTGSTVLVAKKCRRRGSLGSRRLQSTEDDEEKEMGVVTDGSLIGQKTARKCQNRNQWQCYLQ